MKIVPFDEELFFAFVERFKIHFAEEGDMPIEKFKKVIKKEDVLHLIFGINDDSEMNIVTYTNKDFGTLKKALNEQGFPYEREKADTWNDLFMTLLKMEENLEPKLPIPIRVNEEAQF